jgi:hypothetical protein
MASFPVRPTFAGMRRGKPKPKPTAAPSATAATIRIEADDDSKRDLAHRLRTQDRARKTTSVPPPTKRPR